MKDYTLIATQPTANQDDSFPNVFSLHHGLLYSRWFVLSALFDAVLAVLGYLCWYIVPRPPSILSSFWHISTWAFLNQSLLVVGIFIIFLLGSIIAFLVGYRFFEASPNVRLRRNCSRAIDFESLRWLLTIYGVLVFTVGLYDWLLKKIQPVPLALALIFLFLTIWILCNNRLRKKEKAPLKKEDLDMLSARHLFYCLFRLKMFLRTMPDNPETTLAGMKHLPKI